jgi:transcriptional regulator of arginine metabolism
MSKAGRQARIADWLRGGTVQSQEDVVARLAEEGLLVTQATVSRDFDELGAVRVKGPGGVRYRMPEAPDVAARRLDRLLADWVLAMVAAGPLLVLRTPPGSANLVASALDGAMLAEVAGTIAGDDTIFVALSDGHSPAELADALERRRQTA